MRITNELQTRRIDLFRIESVKEHYPSHRIQIGVETEDIQANFNKYTWISDTEINKFLFELDTLDKSRKGQATLESMSPGELKLTFKATDTAGHLSVTIQFANDGRIGKDYSFDIKLEFQVDPTSVTFFRTQLFELVK